MVSKEWEAFEDLFANFGFNRRQVMKNKNVQIAHTIELEDVLKGKSVITKYTLQSQEELKH